MKLFPMRELAAAREHAMKGGQALHIHNVNAFGHRLFRRYPEIAHLFDQNKERLVRTAKQLGVRVIKIDKENTSSQHIDLCGKPFERAKEDCKRAEDSAQCYADGTLPRRGDTIVTVKYKETSPFKSAEDRTIWIVTTLLGDMLRAKSLDADSWRQAHFTRCMEPSELKT